MPEMPAWVQAELPGGCDSLPPLFIDEFVEAVTPVENHHYRWKMTFGEMKSGQERYNLMEPENSPVLSFTIDFETARQYRMSNGLPAQFRQRGWTDLNVEVYL